MAARIPISWLLVLALLAVFAFFGYQILQVSQDTKTEEKFPPYSPTDEVKQQGFMDSTLSQVPEHSGEPDDAAAPVSHKQPPVPRAMPHVPGQTEEDLREHEPLQQSPPATQYDSPESTDPMNRNVFMNAEFGSNLRHPEQMMEARPGMTMDSVVESGIGSMMSSPGGNRAASYAPEMAQNGGEFMSGINAFDGSDSGVGYSML